MGQDAPTRAFRFTRPGAHFQKPCVVPLDAVLTAWAPSTPLVRQLKGRTRVRATPLCEHHWGPAVRWAARRVGLANGTLQGRETSMRTMDWPEKAHSGVPFGGSGVEAAP